jgi:5-formyltetrahydrofolate cyclo-ligase
MTTPIATAKNSLRLELRSRLLGLSEPTLSTNSNALCARMTALGIWQRASSVLLFAPLAGEPDIWPLLAQGLAENKIIALPGFVRGTNSYLTRRIIDPARDLIVGKFGIREPADVCPQIPVNHLDLVLVPGVAFDARGGRLGRGKGYYDRLLADVRGTKCGVAFDEQIVPAVPVEPLDIPLNCILTPTRWIET